MGYSYVVGYCSIRTDSNKKRHWKLPKVTGDGFNSKNGSQIRNLPQFSGVNMINKNTKSRCKQYPQQKQKNNTTSCWTWSCAYLFTSEQPLRKPQLKREWTVLHHWGSVFDLESWGSLASNLGGGSWWYNPHKQTNVPWKSMVGSDVLPIEMTSLFSGDMLCSFSGETHMSFWKNRPFEKEGNQFLTINFRGFSVSWGGGGTVHPREVERIGGTWISKKRDSKLWKNPSIFRCTRRFNFGRGDI